MCMSTGKEPTKQSVLLLPQTRTPVRCSDGRLCSSLHSKTKVFRPCRLGRRLQVLGLFNAV